MPVISKKLLKNRYEIKQSLGRGGMGAVYKALDMVLDIDVAVKELLNKSFQSVEQFEKEGKILAKLKHPNIPRVTDYFEENGRKYLIMDFIEGKDLQEILERSRAFLREQDVLSWILQVMEGLEYIHSKGVIHRDIKPANIKLTSEGKIFLVDFGIAKMGFNVMTSLGAQGFTPYMAPLEQYTGKGGTGVYSDIYSAGATIYYLLTGMLPAEAVMRLMGTELIYPKHINPTISEKTEELILKSMNIEPGKRYQSAGEMKENILCSINLLQHGKKPLPSFSGQGFRRDIRRR